MTDENKEHPAVRDDICGITTYGGTGIEWICILKPHGKVYYRRKSDQRHRRGDPVYSDTPSVHRHLMVNRWPNREQNTTEH